jgi:hypothetical protein
MGVGSALETLQAAVDHCSTEDVEAAELDAALDFLQARSKVAWLFDQFRTALTPSLVRMGNRRAQANSWRSE